MFIDHIFVYSSRKGLEADHLVDFGLMEGSRRDHPGQGTTNRKFYFENFFLEVLWVINEEELKSDKIKSTKLWERSQFQGNACSPYGLCLVNDASTDQLFQKSQCYQPSYFPEGMEIEVLTNESRPYLPWTFRLPFRNEIKYPDEPRNHVNGIRSLTKAVFVVENILDSIDFIRKFGQTDQVDFIQGEDTQLILEFDHHKQSAEKKFEELKLTIRY